ncbi:HNH endonuclease signature motif containing protein [Albimonas sp. CAU 1670]|uniref:HNH endonuclease n=1 Tax=Albimonas sp. CAU 1670 TaxID=3032599 RepID=UPI0023DBFDE6|nr:HNH endonuclease signature motif containing protein [Albimonas sp. CAU 1670]MDF2231392.1 HNH endonuclease signature motif containing protein [Albimonas sp. CAU 1670]
MIDFKAAPLRSCFSPPIPQIAEAAELLSRAADAHLAGDAAEAERLIRAADMPPIAAWTRSIFGKVNPDLHAFRQTADAPPLVAKADRPRPRMPGVAIKKAIEARDGLRCRFCGMPVIRPQVRARLHALYPDAARWGPRDREQHAALQCMWLQYDHVLPNSRGGDSSPENVVVTCAPCNFGRGNWTVAEVGIADPRDRAPGPVEGWDGLDRLLEAAPHPVAREAARAPDETPAREPEFDSGLADALDEFEEALADRGAWVDVSPRRARIYRWRAPGGQTFTLGAACADGTFETYLVGWPAETSGPLPLAHAFLRLLAGALGGAVRETPTGHQWHVRGPDGAQPRLTLVLERSDACLSVIDAYLAALAGAVNRT